MKAIVNHIGIIMDGNRRYAKQKGMPSFWGHQQGAEKFRKVIEWLRDLNVKEATFYTFSMQNFERSKEEVSYLFTLFEKEFGKFIKDPSELKKHEVRIRFVGRLHLFPKEMQETMYELMKMTKDYSKHFINFAIGYGGREEIVDAVKRVIEAVQNNDLSIEEVDEKKFANFLYLNSDPDFIIRTSGEMRTSNFLIWQSSYSEWFFLEKAWPEIEKGDIQNCISDFQNRERRIGK